MNKRLTLGSLFDGSGGFPLASILAGIDPVWASEVEPFAVRVTTKRLPGMIHYGDVSALSGARTCPSRAAEPAWTVNGQGCSIRQSASSEK